MALTLFEKQNAAESLTLYSGLSARSRPRRSAWMKYGRGERLLPRYLRDVVEDAVFVEEVRRLKLARGYLVFEPEGDARVDHGLAASVEV